MQGVCSDQMLKRQLQSLKASFINLGQKEAFAEGEWVPPCPQGRHCEACHAMLLHTTSVFTGRQAGIVGLPSRMQACKHECAFLTCV